MAQQLVTVCVLCLLCATHAQCGGSHGDNLSALESVALQKLSLGRPRRIHCPTCRRLKRDVSSGDHTHEDHKRFIASADEDQFSQLRRIFAEYGDPTNMTMNFDGFARLVRSGKLSSAAVTDVQTSNSTGEKTAPEGTKSSLQDSSWRCLQPAQLLAEFGVESDAKVGEATLLSMCPTLLASMAAPVEQERQTGCVMVPPDRKVQIDSASDAEKEEEGSAAGAEVWLCAIGSILVVSLCGLLGVAIIPFMQRLFYQQLLQFLVALAIGTLCGDALLHLLPHAILGPEPSSSKHSHDHDEEESHAHHATAVWRGCVACLGLIFFFVTEKCLNLVAEWRKRRQRRAQPVGGHRHRVRVMRDNGGGPLTRAGHGNTAVNGSGGRGDGAADMDVSVPRAGGKQCKHKYSSYPYCYGEISDAADLPGTGEAEGLTASARHSLPPEPAPCCLEEIKSPGGGGDVTDAADGQLDIHPSECESYTVIIREHETAHHGHSHTHGHVHAAPRSLSSVAWMVVMGDGLHNLTDGAAVGAAFAAGLAGGFSTALAVLCHELPHELGDFAVLLRAGMPLRQAAAYNVLSSLLGLAGALLGVALGHSPSAAPWVFGAAAGMFLYIALVDMIPELSSNHSQEDGSICQCVLQVLGMLTGTGVMLLIALYEHDLKTVFKDSDSHAH